MEAATEVTLARLKQRACFCTVHAYMRAKHEVLTWGILFIVCVAALVCLINGCMMLVGSYVYCQLAGDISNHSTYM